MKIICVGRNYADHAKELGNKVPEEPVLFMKPKNALLPTGSSLFYPAFTNELHYECEIVIKICKNGKFISISQAKYFYNEITLGIDFTARDIQDKLKKKSLPWEKAKAFDHSAAIGEWIDVNRLPDRNDIHFNFHKNGIVVQEGFSKDMLFNIEAIISDASQYFTLNIGDLIYTGTPPGVGETVVGDILEAYLENTKVLSMQIR